MSDFLLIECVKSSFNGYLTIGDYGGHVKIDTGCSFTYIPLMGFGFSSDLCKDLKRKDIESYKKGEIKAIRSIGIESDMRDKRPSLSSMSSDELFADTSVCFIHRHELSLNGYDLGVRSFKVNYDRYNYGLIGMDILSSMLCIIAPSEIRNNSVFLGVSDSQPNKNSFYEAIEMHFRLFSLGISVIDDEMTKNRASGFNEFLKFFSKNKR